MTQLVRAYGQILRFPKEMADDAISKAILDNEHVLNPDYKTPASSKVKDLAKEYLGVDADQFSKKMSDSRKSIADLAEESAARGEDTAAPQVPGAPVRQSTYNSALLNDKFGIKPQENLDQSGVLGRIRKTADEDIRGQEFQENLRGAITDAPPEPEGGFIPSAISITGLGIRGAGRIGSDYLGADADNSIAAYGQKLIDENPVAIRGLEDIQDKPFLAVREALGTSAPTMTGMVGAKALGMGITSLAPLAGPAAPIIAAVGQAVQWLGPAAVAALPSYASIRDKQILNDPLNEADGKAKAIAALGAGTISVIEQAFGPQRWAMAMLTKEGRSVLARKFAATTTIGAIAKGTIKGGAIEGAEEIAQNPIEQLASFDDPTTKENIKETIFGGAMGAIGGGVMGGGVGGVSQITRNRDAQILIEKRKLARQQAEAVNRRNAQQGHSDILNSGSVDEAIQAANNATSKKSVTKDDVLRTIDPTLADIERLTGLKPSESIEQAINQAQQGLSAESIPAQGQQGNVAPNVDVGTQKKPASQNDINEYAQLINDVEARKISSPDTWTESDEKMLSLAKEKLNSITQPKGNIYEEETSQAPSTKKSTRVLGNSTEIVLPDNITLPAQWEIVDADNIKATIKEGVNQPRDRTRASSDIQIQEISNNLDYRRLSDSPVLDIGAPAISHDGLIVAGNGRFEAVSLAHDKGMASDYLSALKNDAVNKGIDPAVIESMKKPVLVRRITQPYDTRKLAIDSNAGTSLQYSGMELAKIDAERMKGIEDLDITDTGDIALTGSNIAKLKQSLGGYNNAELASLVDKNGALSQDGVRRVRNSILAKAYGDSDTLGRLVESAGNDARNVLGALTRSAGVVAKVRSDIKAGALPKELDITRNLLNAVETLSQIRTKGQPLEQYLAQDNLFGDDIDADSKEILKFLHDNIRSQKKLTEFINNVYNQISNIDQSTEDIFGDNVIPSKQDVIQNAKQSTAGQTAEQQDIFARQPGKADEQAAQTKASYAGSSKEGWVIRNKATGETIFETYDQKKVDALNTDKYEAVPAKTHLVELNDPNSKARQWADRPEQFKKDQIDEELKFSRSPEERIKDRERAKQLESKLREQGYNFTIKTKDVRDFAAMDRGRQNEAVAAEQIAANFGKRIVWIEAIGDFEINGVMIPSIKDTIFIDVTTDKYARAVMGHELSHHMERDNPDLYRDLVDSLENLIKNHDEYADKYGIEGEDRSYITKEIVGDIMGDNFTDQGFWNKVAEYNPSAFRKIADKIITWLKNLVVKAKSRGLGSEQWVTDAQEAQDIIAKSVAKYTNKKSSLDGLTNKAMFQKAWHASPFDHTGFDSSKIGTGEGFQAFGFGHYFADSRHVSEWYQDKFSKTGLSLAGESEVNNRIDDLVDNFANDTTADYWRYGIDEERSKAIKAEKDRLESEYSDYDRPEDVDDLIDAKLEEFSRSLDDDDLLDAFMSYDERVSDVRPIVVDESTQEVMDQVIAEGVANDSLGWIETIKAKLYEVELAPKQDEYLLYDAALDEQSDKVRDALRGKLIVNGVDILSGNKRSGKDLYKSISQSLGGDKEASKFLHNLGIRGIKYLDGSSRYDAYEVVLSTKKGKYSSSKFKSRNKAEQYAKEKREEGFSAKVRFNEGANFNYVIFDDKDISIIAKFSRAGSPKITLSSFGDFRTGSPVTFNYLHNKESATSLFGKPTKESRFGRQYEPSGKYVVSVVNGRLAEIDPVKYEYGELSFSNPLVVANNNLEWKKELSDTYGGKTGRQLSKALIADGYDGVVTVDKYGTSEILDLTTFDESKAKFSKAHIENTLIAQHNLSTKNLLHADRMGGLATPSIAVTDKTHPLEGFGEITLLSDKDLIDPKKGAKIFGSDIYSPRYPSVSYDFSKDAIKELNSKLSEGIKKTGSGELYTGSLDDDPARELKYNAAVMYQFLKELGETPGIRYIEERAIDDALKPFAEGNKDIFDLTNDDAFKNVSKELFLEMSSKESLNDDQVGNIVRSYAGDVIAYRDSKRNVGKVSQQKTKNALSRQISDNRLSDKFDVFIINLIDKIGHKERIFQGYTNSGKRKYIPHTIDNVIKILKKELRGGENFKYGLGSVRAKYSPQFKSIDQIRNSKDRLMDSKSFEQVKKELNEELSALAKEVNKYGTYSGFDNVENMLSDAATMGVSRALTYNGFENVPDDIKLEIDKFIGKLRNMPTEYFEAKILRGVSIGEFDAAIIPDDSPKQVKDILNKNGIEDIREYKSGDNEDRVRKINEVDRLMFSRAENIPETINISGKSLSQFANAIAKRYKANKIAESQGSRYYSLPDGRELRVSDHEFPRKHGGGAANIDIIYNKEDDGVDIFHNEVKTGIITKELSYRSLNLRGHNIGGLEGFNYDIDAWESAVTGAIYDVISNAGAFSSESDDIRFSRAEKQKEPLMPESKFRKFQRFWQDDFNRFAAMKEWLADRGINLSEQADVSRAEERYHSKVANQIEDFNDFVARPLIEKIAKSGFTMSDVADYLEAQHAEEANAAIAKLHKDPSMTAYGITNDEAEDYLSKAPKELGALANEFRNITEKTKKLLLDEGLRSQEEVDAWEAAYKHYIPVKGGDKPTKGTGKGLSVQSKTKRRLGHGRRDEAVIENILLDYNRAVIEVEKNRIAKHLGMMAAEIAMPELMTIGQPMKRKVLKSTVAYEVQVKGVTRAVFDSKDGANVFKQMLPASDKKIAPSEITINPTRDQRIISSASPMLAENEINMYIDGHAIRMQINDEIAARAYKHLGIEGYGHLVAAGRAINGYLSKAYTGYAPEWGISNIIRDFTAGIINLTGEEGIVMAAKAVKNYPGSFASLLRYAFTGRKKSNKWIDMYRANGGNTGAAWLPDMERLSNDVASEYAAAQGVVSNLKQGDMANASRAALRKLHNVFLKWLNNLNQASENAMRLAALKAMIESGKSVNEASHISKNITINFNKKGEFGQTANAAYLFFNATMNGQAAMNHALFKGKHKYQAWALGGAGLTALGYTMAAMLGGGDEDEYDKLDDYTKERNMVIKSGDGWIKIPVPYGHGFFWSLGRSIADAQRKDELGTLPWHIASSAIEELTPLGGIVVGSDEEFKSDQVILGLLPTVAQIAAQPALNKSIFSGSEIMPESPFDKSQPDRDKMWRGTKGTIYDKTAEWLEDAGIDISPETLKHLTRSATGGAGSTVDAVISSVMLKSQGAELDANEMPFARKLYHENTIRSDRAAFQKAKGEARAAAEEFRRASRDNDLVSIDRILKDKHEMLMLDNYANKLQKFINIERDEQDAVRTNESIPIAERRLKLKELEAKEAKFYNEYLDVFKIDKSVMKERLK